MRTLEGLSIILIGASGGMGSSTALRIAAPGVKIAICARREEKLLELAENLREKGAVVFAQKADVTKPSEIKSFIDGAVDKFGSADILVNFAGLSVTADLADITEEQYDLVMDVNVKGTLFAAKYFCDKVDRDRGALVINFGSMASKRANPSAAHYSGAKAAVNLMTNALSMQLGKNNIRFTTINPGPTDTDFFEGRIPPEKRTDFLEADDVAELLEFIMTRDERVLFHDVMLDSFHYYKGRK